VFPCHGLGGIVGTVLTGVLAKDVGLVYGQTRTFLLHLAALVIVGIFSFGGSWLLYKLVDLIVPLRVSPSHEEQGLDLSQHGETVGEIGVAAAAHARSATAAKPAIEPVRGPAVAPA
jgi:Amt family ammonium transporter